jgi:uncharacterized protein YlxW (UPF0749 family)
MRNLLIAGVAGVTLVSMPIGAARIPVHGAQVSAAQPAPQSASARQKKIAEDSAKLLQMANDLKAEVEKTSKDQMSLEVIRKADEIEKLAHDLKLRMKG